MSNPNEVKRYSSNEIEYEEIKSGKLFSWVKYSSYQSLEQRVAELAKEAGEAHEFAREYKFEWEQTINREKGLIEDNKDLERRVADCESGIYQNRIVKIVSQRNSELELENKRLKEALEKHGKHNKLCNLENKRWGVHICDCGFEQALGGKE